MIGTDDGAGGAETKPVLIFIIDRLNYYRLLGALIDEGLRQGFRVECWHDYSQPQTGRRDYLFPAIEKGPAFNHGKPDCRPFRGISEVSDRCRELGAATVFSLFPPTWYPEFAKPEGTRWYCLQHGQDVFFSNPLRTMVASDAILIMAPFWIEFALDHYRSKGPVTAEDEAEFRGKCRLVGFPEADSFHHLDPAAIRRKFGLPPGKKVVLYLPWDKNVDFGAWSAAFSFPSRPRRFVKSLMANPGFLRFLLEGWHEFAVFRGLKKWCRRENAVLIVKSRKKSMDGRYISAWADGYHLDLSDYPPTIIELLRISDLCLHYYSFATQEIAAAEVPAICVHMDPFTDKHEGFLPFRALMLNRDRNFFLWKGFSQVLDVRELLSRFRGDSFERLASSDREGIQGFQDEYLGRTDGQACARALRAAQIAPEAAEAARRTPDVRT